MSGYDIKGFLRSLGWLIGSPSYGSLYPALHALHKGGLVTVDTHSCQGKPPRKIYKPTEAGRQVLQEWIDQPTNSNAPLKAFVMRLVLADSFSPVGLITYLRQRRVQVLAHQAALRKKAAAVGERANLGQYLMLDYGLAMATAELAWLDSTLERLSQPLPTEVIQGDSVISTV